MRQCIGLAGVVVICGSVGAQCGTTTMLSVTSDGTQASNWSTDSSVSADGRFVVFSSVAIDLVPGDKNNKIDIFVRDRREQSTTLVSVSTDGAPANSDCRAPRISANGRIVVYHSEADTLVESDTNNVEDIFVHDRTTGVTTRASVTSKGEEAPAGSALAAVSGSGRYVVFQTGSRLVPEDTDGLGDIYRHDLITGEIIRVSVGAGGFQFNDHSIEAAISFDGQIVVFSSEANNVDDGDIDGRYDIYLRDIVNDETILISRNSAGESADKECSLPVVSADGRVVAFLSEGTNLLDDEVTATTQAFWYDRKVDAMRLVSRSYCGEQGDGRTDSVAISADGVWAAIFTGADNLAPTQFAAKIVFVRNMQTHQVFNASITPQCEGSGGDSFSPALSENAHVIAFDSFAEDLVDGDSNDEKDVFAHEVGCLAAGDLDYDGNVGAADLILLLGCWGACTECSSDFNQDGQIGASDLIELLGDWGPCKE